MKLSIDLFGGKHPNRRRQCIVQSDDKIRGWNRRLGLKSCDLRQCVHAGIRAARSLRQELLAGDAFDRCRQRALDGVLIRLHLPAGEVGTVIGEHKFEVA